jgi:hypothetical protein
MVLQRIHRNLEPPARRLAGSALAGLCALVIAWPALAQTASGGGSAGGGSGGGTGGGGTAGTTAGGGATGGAGTGGTAGGTAATGPRSTALRFGTLGFPVGADTLLLGAPQRAWTFRPSLSVDVIATDNVRLTSRDRQSDISTAITPSILAVADTARLQGVLSYRPIGYLYASTPDQNRIDHFLDAQGLATLVEDRFFLDMRAASSVSSLTGGLGTGYSPGLARNDRVQTTSARVSPYLQFRFGGLGTLQTGYAFQYVDQTAGRNGIGGGAPTLPAAGTTGFNIVGDYTAHEGFATFRTGDDFGRFGFVTRLSAIEYDGTGVLDGASRQLGVVEASYAVTRSLSLLADGGYERQRYGGPRPFELDSPIWGAGVQLTGPDSAITARYGRRDGFESATLDGSVALGARTRLTARYEERLTTTQQLAGARLAAARLDQFGNQVDPITGVPLLPGATESLLAQRGGLFRLRTAGVSLSQVWDRDVVTVSAGREERTPVNGAPALFNTNQNGYSASVSWTRELSPEMSGSLFAQYGVTDVPSGPDRENYSAGASLSRQLGQGITGTMQYRYTSRDDAVGGGRAIQNLVLVGLRKDFW